jgi:ATP-dependent protease HslVU (ClpYQ) peptidase subunit
MTTIAYRDGVLAADSRLTVDYGSGARKHTTKKLFRKRITEGKKSYDVIIATAGESSPGMVFLDWYGSGKPIPDMFLHMGGDFTCLVLTPKGLYEYDVYCRGELIEEEFYAVGSGSMAALAAMHCGKSAVEAVRIASRIDPYTGGRIIVESIIKPEAKNVSQKAVR